MSKYVYIAYTAEQDRNATIFLERSSPDRDAGYYADVLRVSVSDDLCASLGSIAGLMSARVFASKRDAEIAAKSQNDEYKRNGSFFV